MSSDKYGPTSVGIISPNDQATVSAGVYDFNTNN